MTIGFCLPVPAEGIAVHNDSVVIFLDLPPDQYELLGDIVTIRPCVMFHVYFAAIHRLVMDPHDFRLWCDPDRN